MIRASRSLRLAALVAVVAALGAGAAHAAPIMPVGFQDDPNFRWNPDRQQMIDKAAASGATVFRTTVYWNLIAPTRPTNGADPFDKAYRFDDLDEMVRRAQFDGVDVLLTIWGTPSWAGPARNRMPNNVNDLQNFAKALASRYSGRYAGYPFVRYFSVWNEPNLAQFLAPQFDAKGKIVSPVNYAKLYRAAYAGIKAGNPLAKVGIGETSPRGRDKPLGSSTQQDTTAPGTWAQILSQQKPKVQFDAWAHHPYPPEPWQGPATKVAWPNVVLTNLGQFETNLDKWFGRKNTPIWVTEYGFQTNPPSKLKATTYSQQSQYLVQSLNMVKADPRVQMYIWFVFRDDKTSTWASGLLQQNSTPKPAFSAWTANSWGFDPRSAEQTIPAGVTNPTVTVYVPELAARAGVGSPLSVHYVVSSVTSGNQTVAGGVSPYAIGIDSSFTLVMNFTPLKGAVYRLHMDIQDQYGNIVRRDMTLRSV